MLTRHSCDSEASPPNVPSAPTPPICRPKPIAQKPMTPIEYTKKFIAMVWATFLERVRPVSTSAKPACMNMTKKPHSIVHTRFAEMVS